MMKRPRTLLTYFILCAIPLLLLAALNYWNGIRSVNATVAAGVQNDLNAFNVAADEVLGERRREILRLAITNRLQKLAIENESTPDLHIVRPENVYSLLKTLPELREFQSLTVFDRNRKPLFIRPVDDEWKFAYPTAENLPQPDQRLWAQQGNVLIENLRSAAGTLELGAPLHDEKTGTTEGAVVAVLDLQRVFAIAARGLESRANKTSLIIVQNSAGNAVYQTDRSQAGQTLPGYVTVSAPIPQLDVTATVARRRSDFMTSAHVWGIAGLVLALLSAVIAALVLDRNVQKRTSGIARVKEDLSAIAKGELDRRIMLQSSDDARGLADNINVVTERLRAQIAREEESRQFESFVRLSAMLTHDLKNAIEGLSLTVGNMERHFDNPQFRADALKGLTTATEKLKALVVRLARPVTTLSGEHKRPTNVDLIPILQRVIAMHAEPLRDKFTIVTRLPQSLYALADAARVEEVMENLVLNALEAMDKGGTLTIEAAQTANGAPTFSVSDTGKGMSKTFIETRLFRPFSTTKKTGIGLGLYTCREVIRASAGKIDVESVEGAGTTFRVVLPSIPHDGVTKQM